VGRNDDFERVALGMLLQANVTAVLAHHDPTVALESTDNAVVGKLRNFCQTAISTTSVRSVASCAMRSSSTGSR
jgi:hypothetical protein